MALRIGSTVLNVRDLALMERFWTQALGLRPDGDDAFRVLRGEHVNLSLQVGETGARGLVHLDLYADDVDAEVERLQQLGATWVRRSDDPDDAFVTLADPEGNPFCVCPA